MKVVIMTDSHGRTEYAVKVIENENPDKVIWTGDGTRDADDCAYAFPNIEFFIVRGNCDFFDRKHQDEEIITIENKKIFITHGHEYRIKINTDLLEKKAETLGVEAVCFGHTHKETYIEKNGIKYFNPGALTDGKYGVLTIKENELNFEFKKI